MTEFFKPNPKTLPIKLSPTEYRELREKIWVKQRGLCKGCGYWFGLNFFSLHHIKTRAAGGSDIESNLDGYCLRCHPD